MPIDRQVTSRDRSTGYAMDTPLDHLEQIVAAACCLVTTGNEIEAVQVLTHRRLAYAELMRCRTVAEEHGCTMTVLGSGGVGLRTRAA